MRGVRQNFVFPGIEDVTRVLPHLRQSLVKNRFYFPRFLAGKNRHLSYRSKVLGNLIDHLVTEGFEFLGGEVALEPLFAHSAIET